MAEGQRRLAGVHGGDVHRLEAGVVQPFGVVVVVSEDQDSLARTVPDVEHQVPVASGVGMGDVAQADDRVVGVYAPAPFSQQVVVHLLDVPERAVSDGQHCAVREVQVRPDPGPFRRTADDRDRCVLHQRRQASGWLMSGLSSASSASQRLRTASALPASGDVP